MRYCIHWVKINTAGLDNYALNMREHLWSSRGVIGVSQKQPLVYEAVLCLIIDQPEVKLERANQSVRYHLLCIEQLDFSQTVKHLVRALTKVEKQNLQNNLKGKIFTFEHVNKHQSLLFKYTVWEIIIPCEGHTTREFGGL